MKTNKIVIFIILAVTLAFSCYPKLKNPVLPGTPQNMADANSEYDDYNSIDPNFSRISEFYFSSNRYSKGADFDIIAAEFHFDFDRSSGNYQTNTNLYNSSAPTYYNKIPGLLPLINTKYNELGPYGFTQQLSGGYRKDFILYANDSAGNYDIKFAYSLCKGSADNPEIEKKSGFYANLLNSYKDDMYPTIDYKNGIIYFCSNRTGNFQIYQIKIDTTKDLTQVLQSTGGAQPELVQKFQSTGNDKCPFIKNNVLVFTSDRPGGYGGFDLYYSVNNNGVWSDPQNFGSTINTNKDEYRPVIDKLDGFEDDLLIFSSNREGGKGGFDLYYTGVKQIIE
jgi:hypothetical protein